MKVENTSLDAVDDHTEEGHLTKHFVHGAAADEVFLSGVSETVEARTQQRKEVAFDLVAAGNIASV